MEIEIVSWNTNHLHILNNSWENLPLEVNGFVERFVNDIFNKTISILLITSMQKKSMTGQTD